MQNFTIIKSKTDTSNYTVAEGKGGYTMPLDFFKTFEEAAYFACYHAQMYVRLYGGVANVYYMPDRWGKVCDNIFTFKP